MTKGSLTQVCMLRSYDSSLCFRHLDGGTWSAWKYFSYDVPAFYKNYADLSSLANALGVGDDIVGTFTGKISGTSSDPIIVCQDVVSAITTGGKHTVVNCIHDCEGLRFVHGYLYSTKDYGYFTITFYGTNNRAEVKLLNNTYTVTSN